MNLLRRCFWSLVVLAAPALLCAQTSDDLPLATLPQLGAGPALIIAVDAYGGDSAFADLPGIRQDREAVKGTLLRLGFREADITVLINPGLEEMYSAMNRFGELAAATRKASFLYFTGHGVLLDGKNYLIPARTRIRVQGQLPTSAVPIEHVLGYLGGEDCGPALVFVDACRNNTLPRTAKSASSPVSFQRQAGLFIGYATGEGRVSNASEEGSVYTSSLCKRLLTPGRSVDDLYAGVIHDVQEATKTEKVPQDPQKQSALRFVFHLVPGRSAPPGSAAMTEEDIQRRIEEEVRKRMASAGSAVSSPAINGVGAATVTVPPAPSAGASGNWEVMVPFYPKPMFVGTPVPAGNIPNLEKPDPEALKSRLKFMVPRGTENVAKGKKVTSSDPLPIIGSLDLLTDGDADASDGCYVELAPGHQWVQIDLGAEHDIWKVLLWHFHKQTAVYFDLNVQVSNDPEFRTGVTGLYNNDHDDSSKLGQGADKAYVETNFGRLIEGRGTRGRYVRFYSNGNTANEMNHYIEASVYGTPAVGSAPSGPSLPIRKAGEGRRVP